MATGRTKFINTKQIILNMYNVAQLRFPTLDILLPSIRLVTLHNKNFRLESE